MKMRRKMQRSGTERGGNETLGERVEATPGIEPGCTDLQSAA
jgi:hypothetical protein